MSNEVCEEDKIKFPYVLDYSLFNKIDLGVAEELLVEYNDFYEYNKAQLQNAFVKVRDSFSESPEDVDDQKKAEHNLQVSLDHFSKLFGSKDFAESSLVGLKIDYYDLQQILMDEFRAKTSILESRMNAIAPRLRAVASVLLFAERVVAGLWKLLSDSDEPKAKLNNEKVELAIEFARDGFRLLLGRVAETDLDIPEYNKSKGALGKMKTVEHYIDFCEKLFFIQA